MFKKSRGAEVQKCRSAEVQKIKFDRTPTDEHHGQIKPACAMHADRRDV